MAPERRASPEQVPSRRIPVLVGTLPIEDGQSPPPVVGELGRFPLIFTEARDDESDATVSTWRVRAEPGNDGKPRGPGRRWDGTPYDRPPYWPTTLHGVGWSANWSAPRPVTGQVELRGTLVGDLGISSRQWVRGRVIRARVVTETIDTSDPDQQRWRPVRGRQSLREVEVAPRWFDHGLVAPPDAPSTGWYSPVPGDPYVVETGVLVELDLDDVPPLPLRPAIVPAAVAAHGEDLWVADAALPLVVRLRGADPRPGAGAPEVHRYSWPGRILTDSHTGRRVHADADGCWITGPDGVYRADLDGHVRQVDGRMVTTVHASAGRLLVDQLPADAGPTADALEVGPARPAMLDAHQVFATAGRVFTLGSTPDAGRRPVELAEPGSWWPLPGPFTHPEGGRYDLLTELDPYEGGVVDTTLVGRPDHVAVDGSGTVWLLGHTSIYSCSPGPGTTAEPFDVAALLDPQEPT